MIGGINLVEALIASIQDYSGSSRELSGLHGLLKGAENSLQGNADVNYSILVQLDPSRHSLGYLFFLEILTSGRLSREKASLEVPIIVGFINSCDAGQIRLAKDKFVSLCQRLKVYVFKLGDLSRGVWPLLTALQKLQLSTKRITALHSDLLQLCFLSDWYKTGFSIISDNILEFDQPRDFLIYCFYGGMICIGLKKYQKALELLYNVVTAPMHLVDDISHVTYRKYMLVSLIINGQFLHSLPHWASPEYQMNFKDKSGPYSELGDCYNAGKIVELEALILANTEDFEMEHNLGLAEQAVSSLSNRYVLRLTQKYLTLSLQDIANMAHFADAKKAEMHVLHMIQDAQIHALIDQRYGMVRFLEDPEQYKTSETTEILDSVIQRTMRLSKNLSAMNESLSCDPLYLENVGKETQSSKDKVLDESLLCEPLYMKKIERERQRFDSGEEVLEESIAACDLLYMKKIESERQRFDSGEEVLEESIAACDLLYMKKIESERQRYSDLEDQQDQNLDQRPRQRRRYDSGEGSDVEGHQDQNLTQRQP